MLRLGVSGGIEDHWRDVARRLRGAALDPDAPAEQCDAVVLLAEDDGGAVGYLLGQGKHVLLADEGALSAERLAAWPGLTRRDGPHLAVLNRERFLPSRQLVRQQLSQNLGEPGLVRVHRWAGSLSAAHLLRDLDLILWMTGRAPDVVHAWGREGDLLQVHLGFPGGGMALLAHSAGPHLAAGYSSFNVIGANGAAYTDDHANQQLLFSGGYVHAVRASAGVLALTAMVQSFVDSIAAGKVDDLSAWYRVLKVRDAVTASLADGKAVRPEGN